MRATCCCRVGHVEDEVLRRQRARLDADHPGAAHPPVARGRKRPPREESRGGPNAASSRGPRRRGTAPGTTDAVHRHQAAGLPDACRLEARHVVEAQHVGLVAGCEPAQVVEVVVVGRIARREHEGVLDAHPGGDGQAHAVVDVPGVKQRVRLPVVGAERDPVGAVAEHGRDQGGEVARGRALPDEDPHALAALLLGLLERRCTRGRTRRRRPGRRRAAGRSGRARARRRACGRRWRSWPAPPGRRSRHRESS